MVISGLGLWNYGPRWQVFSRFAQSGYEVHYISLSGDSGRNPFVYKVNIPLFERIRGRVITWFLFLFLSLRKAIAIAKENRPSAIYGYEVFGAVPAYIISKIFRIPLILRFQGSILYPYLGKFSLFLHYFYHVVAFRTPANAVIITEDGTYGESVAKYLGVQENKIRLWLNGVDKGLCIDIDSALAKQRLGLPKSAKIVLSLCRLTTIKSVHRLINAIPKIVENRDDVFFVIVGEGSEKVKLHRLVDSLKVPEYVRFVGRIPHADVPSYLAAADIFVALYDLSCLSATVMEAMRCGKCVVALDSGGTRRILKNQQNAVLLKYSQLQNLPKVLNELLEDGDYRNELGARAREFALKHFCNWDERAAKEIKLVKELIEITGDR